MVKTGEVVTDALGELNENASGEPVSKEDGQLGIRYLNDMMFMWDAAGITLGFTRVNNFGEVVTVPEGAIAAIKAHLAIFMASQFKAQINPSLVDRAKLTWTALLNIVLKSPQRRYPSILPIGSGNTSYPHGYCSFYPEVDDAILGENGGLIALELYTESVT